MGNIIKIYLILFTLIFNLSVLRSQVVKITEKDSIMIKKKKEIHEDGLVFNRNVYSLTIFNLNNIHYNKKNGFNYEEIQDGRKYCEKCKKDILYKFLIKKTDETFSNLNYKLYTIGDLFESSFNKNYFLINDIYYENLGTPIE